MVYDCTIFLSYFGEYSYAERSIRMNQFSLQVKEYLLRNNLKQKDIVEKLGLSKNAISQSLNRDNISLDKMLLIADALDCDLEIKLVPKDTRKD